MVPLQHLFELISPDRRDIFVVDFDGLGGGGLRESWGWVGVHRRIGIRGCWIIIGVDKRIGIRGCWIGIGIGVYKRIWIRWRRIIIGVWDGWTGVERIDGS